MRGLSGEQILKVWESGVSRHPLDRALVLLRSITGRSREELARLSIGQRDSLLFRAREATFGNELTGFVACSACQEPLEFAASVQELLAETEASSLYELCSDEYEIAFRLLDSRDLAEVVRATDPELARSMLLSRCVTRAQRSGEDVAFSELPNSVLDSLETRMAELDPQADMQVVLHCPNCELRIAAQFSILDFFWHELSVHARRLLGEIAELARAYSWREADILALSPERRHYYLELARA